MLNYINKFIPILLVLLLILAACSSGDNEQKNNNADSQENKKVVNISAPGVIPSLSPTIADNDFSFTIINQVFEGLYRLNKEGEPELALAAEEPKVSENNKVYTFKIRKDAKWSNGTPVTAHDFEYAWKKAVNPETGAAYGPQFEEIVDNASEILKGKKPADSLGVEALDDRTLKVSLENAIPFFKELLTTAIFFPQPQEFIEKQDGKYASDSKHTLFNGPFVLADWNGTDQSWTYKKNEKYWDKEAVNVDEIRVNVVKDTGTAVSLYEEGKLDRVNLTGEYVDKYRSNQDYHTFLTGATSYIKMNQGKDGNKTNLANLNIRKAMNLALDKDKLVNSILNNGSVVANGNVPKGLAENPKTGEDFRAENGDLTHFDPREAKKHWEKGLNELGKEKLGISLISSDSGTSKQLAENIKYQLEENLPGLTITIRNLTPKASIAANVGQNYEMIMTGWNGDYHDPLTYLNLFITDSPGNHTGYSNKEYDRLVLGAKGSMANDALKRWNAMLKAERMLIEDSAVLIPLYQDGSAFLQKNYLKNFVTYKVGADNYKWIDIEK
ncbi:peptide ABC transporter substrate-binding protein [Virgibacillus phasianinus]|uniref:Peptide ABC transporter substrate-binding protein n=1 Tax=Virgibacillus phasianinus TaxID=2017483 RepID=A0A220U577_9BACI|nr:peptide ABC transporter substrate-binding protein [Virgibacillus phasianinus]ASK63267.1 peptide ABC transporter substrate-binding protein [Virgibacillus phasianinus]